MWYHRAPVAGIPHEKDGDDFMTSLSFQDTEPKVRHKFVLPAHQVLNLQRLAANRHVSENELVSKALDIFLDLVNLFDDDSERRGWYRLAEPSLLRV